MKRPLPFSGEEYVRRLAATRVAMSKAGLDALIVSEPANIAWLTGWDPTRLDAPCAALLTLEGAPSWWGWEGDRPLAQATVWMADHALHAYPHALLQSDDHPFRHLAQLVKELRLSRATIGVELDSPAFTAACIGHLLNQTGAARYLDATGLVDRRRLVKSPEELAYLRRAALIAERALDMVEERVASGLPKSALLSELRGALIDGAEDQEGGFHGEDPAVAPVAWSSADPTAAPGAFDDAPFDAGGAAVIELAAAYRRYHVASTNSFFLTEPSAEAEAAASAAEEGLAAAMAAATPGARAKTAAQAAAEALASRGFPTTASFGRPIGLAYPPRLCERGLSISPGDETPLEIGVTLYLQIPVLTPSGRLAAAVGETVLIGEDGAEKLADATL